MDTFYIIFMKSCFLKMQTTKITTIDNVDFNISIDDPILNYPFIKENKVSLPRDYFQFLVFKNYPRREIPELLKRLLPYQGEDFFLEIFCILMSFYDHRKEQYNDYYPILAMDIIQNADIDKKLEYDDFDEKLEDLLSCTYVLQKKYIMSVCTLISNSVDKDFHFLLKYQYFDNDILKFLYSIPTEKRNQKIIYHILDHFVKPNGPGLLSLKNPIHYVCQYLDTEYIKKIVEKGYDTEYKNEEGKSPIHTVCIYGSFESIQYLVSSGVNVESEDNDGCRAIDYVIKYQPLHILKYMIQRGAILDQSKQKSIHSVTSNTSIETIEYLILKGVDLHSSDEKGKRPIHYFCEFLSPEAIRLLIQEGVHLNVKDDQGKYPLNYLPSNVHYQEIRNVMISKGAKVNSFFSWNTIKNMIYS